MISRCPTSFITTIHQLRASCLEREREREREVTCVGKEMQKSFTKRFSASVLKEQCNEGRIHSLSLLFPCFPAQVAHLQLPGNTPASHALHPCVSREKRGKKKKKRSCRGKIVLTSRERKLFAALPPLSPALSAFHSALNLISPLCRPRVTGWVLKKPPDRREFPEQIPSCCKR